MDKSAISSPTVGINYWKEQRNHLIELSQRPSSSSSSSLKSHRDDDEFASFRCLVSTNLSNLRTLITVYVLFLRSSMTMIEGEEDFNEKEKHKTPTIHCDEEKKSLILESRHAL